MKTKVLLAIADIESAYDHDAHDECSGWLGFGYLGVRSQVLTPSGDAEYEADRVRYVAKMPTVDATVIRLANERGWSSHDLFLWLNSKIGRWFAECATMGMDDLPRAIREESLNSHGGYLTGKKPVAELAG